MFLDLYGQNKMCTFINKRFLYTPRYVHFCSSEISGIGVWAPLERCFIDVRVVHPNCPTHVNKELKSLFDENEKQKKRAYNERILNVEKASFTPIVLATTGCCDISL